MDNQKQKKKKSVMDTLSATMVLVLIALLLVFVGYTYLALKNGYTLDDLIDNIVGNLIGVLAAFLLFDILNNKLTQDAYARETSQQITKTLMGEPEILDSFSDEDKKTFLKSTITSMIKDEDAVDMLSTNMEKGKRRQDPENVRLHDQSGAESDRGICKSRFPRSHRRKVLPDR